MTQKPSGIFNWLNSRLPIVNTYERHLSKHPVPKKVNFWYMFGALASVVLIVQIVSGIWLMFGYENTEEGAFASIEYIMRDIEYGWIIRYMHTTGASMFFAVVYLHMFRGLMYGSYHKPRELVWIFGMTIYFVMMAEGFLGYVLPYGQMSYWGAQVIISLFGAIRTFVPSDLAHIISAKTPNGDFFQDPITNLSPEEKPHDVIRPSKISIIYRINFT